MSESLGPLTFGQKEEQIFLGKELTRHRDYSERTAIMIDDEIRGLVTTNYERAHKIIMDHEQTVRKIAEALLERETLNAVQIETIIEGKDLPKLESPPDQPPTEPQNPVEATVEASSNAVLENPPATPNPEKA
jgi:cell division protease FtsH